MGLFLIPIKRSFSQAHVLFWIVHVGFKSVDVWRGTKLALASDLNNASVLAIDPCDAIGSHGDDASFASVPDIYRQNVLAVFGLPSFVDFQDVKIASVLAIVENSFSL